MAQKPFIVPIPGTTDPDHLVENLGAVNVKFSFAEISQIRTDLTKFKIVVPQGPPDKNNVVVTGVEAKEKS